MYTCSTTSVSDSTVLPVLDLYDVTFIQISKQYRYIRIYRHVFFLYFNYQVVPGIV